MRLFALRTKNFTLVRDDVGQVMWFATKEQARRYRAKLTTDHNTLFITRGIDHKLYKGA